MTSARDGEQRVEVDGHEVVLRNLAKVLYPDTGTTKAEVIDHYRHVAPVLLPHLAGRAVTLRRFPDGVGTPGFFEKRCPSHRPPWVATLPGPVVRARPVDACAIDSAAALVWAANLAAIELHLPMAVAAEPDVPRAVVFDLDPGPPAGLADCARVARWVQDLLAAAGLRAWAKTSGSKGLQLYVPLNTPCSHDEAARFALAVGTVLQQRHPDEVLTSMARAERPGKVLVDWSQNSRHKTTVAVYSLRARTEPTVSTPVTWDEVDDAGRDPDRLRFTSADVRDRLARLGDLFAPVLTEQQVLPGG